jgi:hypothetical protein
MLRFVLLLALGFTPALHAQDEILASLKASRSLKCDFPIGSVVGDWLASGPSIERDAKGMSLHFDAIEWNEKRARLIANQGATDVVSMSSQAAITFVEMTGVGNVNVTTVFATYRPRSTDFIAVTSRHVGLGLAGLMPVTSQYYGSCRVWE